MAGDTFRRYELKYKVPNTVLPAFLDDLLEYMEIDEYSKKTGYYLITNIYYDTPDDTLIRTSLAKPTYKEKLRLRSYGVPNRKTKCFIEIKKKYKGLVSKRRIMAPLERADAYLAGQDDLENVQAMNHQMLHEMDYFRSVYPVIPKLYLSYERKALFGKEDPEFRVTFDKNITVRRYDLELDKGVYGRVLMDDCHLMEVKVLGAVPLWFARLLSKYSIFPTSFSKYGTEYMQYVREHDAGSTRFTPAAVGDTD